MFEEYLDFDLEALKHKGCTKNEEIHLEQIIETMCDRVEQMLSTCFEHNWEGHQ